MFVGGAQYRRVVDEAVSGHVQIALKTAEILRDQGHDVTLITTKAPPEYRIPPIVTLDGIDVRTVVQGTGSWPKQRVNLAMAAIQIGQLYRILRSGRWDVLHFVGSTRAASLLGLLISTGISAKSLVTPVDYRRPSNAVYQRVQQRLLARIDHFLALTDYTRDRLSEQGIKTVSVTPPGIVKHRNSQAPLVTFRSESRGYALFWRNANRANGADICAKVFEILSQELGLYDFVFAVRPGDELEGLLKSLTERHHNVHLLRHPYGDGIDISRLISCAACVLLPFRRLSMHPQFAVLETLLAGKPLITTDVESNKELVEHGRTGYLVNPTDVPQMCAYVKYLLENPVFAKSMGGTARTEITQKWNWQVYAETLAEVYSHL